MAANHILYLTNTILVSLVANGGRISQRKTFPVSGGGASAFEAHVVGLRGLPTHVITDLAEEDFRLDTIPHVGSRDRQAVMARKLTQVFRNSTYRHAIAQGREPDGRRDHRVVYTAITNDEILKPWVEILQRLEVPVEGIYSSAVLSGRLLDALGLNFAHTLLVTFNPGGAVRQTYFRGKELRFSRLSPVDLEEGASLGTFLAEETTRTWQYLDSVRYFSPGDRLEVCVIAHPRDRAEIEPVLRDFEPMQNRLIDIEQAAGKVGMKPPPASSSTEALLAHVFLRRGEHNHFASQDLRRFAVIRRARIAIQAVSVAVLAIGLAYGGWNLSFLLQVSNKNQQSVDRALAIDAERDRLLKSIPSQGVAGQTMRDVVAFHSGSMRAYPTVASFLLPISAVLDRYPDIRLSQIEWQTADDEMATPTLVPIAPQAAPPIKALGPGKASSPATAVRVAAPAEGSFVTGRHAVAILEGTVRVDGLGYRNALEQVRNLVDELGRLDGYRAAMIDSPLDVTPKGGIQGKFGERTPASSQARFSLKVTLMTRPKP